MNTPSDNIELQNCCAPGEIEARSFAIIEQELGLDRGNGSDSPLARRLFPASGGVVPFSGPAWRVARRLVHSSADYDLLPSLHLPDAALAAGVEALRRGAPVFTDTEMARSGMPLRRLNPLGVRAACLLSLPGVAEKAAASGQTRARAAFELAAAEGLLGGSIIAVGNAPTALLALLDWLQGLPELAKRKEAAKPQEPGAASAVSVRPGLPALVIAMPVGFVNAAESKELFLRHAAQSGPPCLAIRGRRGGSPLAAATVNALADLALSR